MSGTVVVPATREAETALVARVAPLAAGLVLEVGPFLVPVGLLAGQGRVEDKDSEEGAATRAFLREDPWAGLGSVHPGGWMLLARDDDTLVIGRRRGVVGLEQVVTLRWDGGRFAATAMGGARLSTGVRGEQVEPVYRATIDGDELVLAWDCGADPARRPQRVLGRVLVHETPAEIHVLVVSVPNPELPPPPPTGDWAVVGTGTSATARVRPPHPVAGRPVLSDQQVPAAPVG